MHTLDSSKAFRRVFSELVDGTSPKGGYVLNSGDIVGSIAHLAYHLGAIRQINKDPRGPKEGTLK